MSESSGQERARLRLAFVCAGDPLDVHTWSGTPFHMLEALRPHFEINLIVREVFPRWFMFLRAALRRLTGGFVDLMWSPIWTRGAGRKTISILERTDCDLVFAVAITPICANLVSLKPTVFVSDATQTLLSDYNPKHRKIAPWLKRSATLLESKSISGAAVCLFPSKWAASSAVRDHGGNPERVVSIPWGPNLIADRITDPEGRSASEWRLLFVGTDWFWKGGDIALDAVARMRAQGLDVHMDVVGSAPSSPAPEIEGVTFHGFLSKNDEAQGEQLAALFRTADVFFLPTRSDALGIVFAEAASYALPSVSYETGGVPSMVVDGETGLLLQEGADGAAFAEALTGLLSDRGRYLKMSRAALERSRTTLNWAAWGQRVSDELSARWGSARAASPQGR